MARPTFIGIQSDAEGWDADLNASISILKDGPFPPHLLQTPLDESDLETTFPAASFVGCIVVVDHSVDGIVPFFSDGATWRRMTLT